VIRRQGGGLQETFTVRKISFGVGVERTFPLHSPSIGKLEVVSRGHVRRAKLYYLRELRGKKARIRERRLGDVELAAIAAAEAERAAAGSGQADTDADAEAADGSESVEDGDPSSEMPDEDGQVVEEPDVLAVETDAAAQAETPDSEPTEAEVQG